MEIAGLTLGVREGVIGLIAFVALYMLVVLLRMRRLRNKLPPPIPVPPSMAAEPPAIPTPPVTATPEVAPELPAAPDIPWNEPPEPAPSSVAPALAREVAQLRDEVDALRGELAALRDDMLHELAHMRAAQTVSPIYGDAMQMAVSGYEPAVIAERCGIARAEAELVVALAKSQEQ